MVIKMTWAPTHVALEAFIVWAGMGKKSREIFKSKRGIYALLTLFALLPDLDTFIYMHRTYLHSITWPLIIILGVIGWLVFMKYFKKEELGERANLVWRSIVVVCSFIFLHDILDLTTGPVLLFYPFDNRLFNLDVYMIWDLDFPLLIRGFNFEWKTISFNEGIQTYFLNLTPEERINYFGTQFIALYISDFPLHALIFLAWFVFFPTLAFTEWLEKYPKPQNFFKKLKLFKSPLLAGGLILLIFGSILGPAFKLHRVENREYSTWLVFSEENTNYGIVQSFDLEKDDIISLEGNFAGNNSACLVGAAIANEEQFSNVSTSLSELFDEYENNSSLTYSWLVSNYRMIIEDFFTNTIDHYYIVPNITNEISFTLDTTMKVYTMIFLTEWNSTQEFQTQAQIISTLTIQRYFEFYFGLSLIIIGSAVSIISITNAIVVKRKELKDEIEEAEQIQENNSDVKN